MDHSIVLVRKKGKKKQAICQIDKESKCCKKERGKRRKGSVNATHLTLKWKERKKAKRKRGETMEVIERNELKK